MQELLAAKTGVINHEKDQWLKERLKIFIDEIPWSNTNRVVKSELASTSRYLLEKGILSKLGYTKLIHLTK